MPRLGRCAAARGLYSLTSTALFPLFSISISISLSLSMSYSVHSPDLFSHLNPLVYYRHFSSESLRPDGRTFLATRSTSLSSAALSHCDSSSFVQIGGTTVVCGLHLEVGLPTESAPDCGRLTVDLSLSPLCHKKFAIGRPLDSTIAIGQKILSTLLTSRSFSLAQLGIEKSHSCFIVYADLVALAFDGNSFAAHLLHTNQRKFIVFHGTDN